MTRASQFTFVLCALAVGLWTAALMFPSIATCVYDSDGHLVRLDWFDRSTVVFWGWGGFIMAQCGWYANITGAIGIISIFYKRRVTAPIIILHMCLVIWAGLPIKLGHNEGFLEPICSSSYGLGFWLWIAAQFAALLGMLTSWSFKEEEDATCPD